MRDKKERSREERERDCIFFFGRKGEGEGKKELVVFRVFCMCFGPHKADLACQVSNFGPIG